MTVHVNAKYEIVRQTLSRRSNMKEHSELEIIMRARADRFHVEIYS